MITISRIGGNPLGVSQYKMTLNNNIISASFNHDRTDDLPTLLRKAADQVIIERAKYGEAIYSTRIPDKSDVVKTADDVLSDILETIDFLTERCKESNTMDEKLAWNLAIDTLAAVVRNHGS